MLGAALCGVVAHAADSKEFKDGWNTWAESKKGDYVEYSYSSGISKRYEVTAVNGDEVTVKIVLTSIDALGRPAEPIEYKPITSKWNKIELVGGWVAKGATWDTKRVRASSGEINCDVASWRFDGTNFGLTYSKSIPCGGVVSASTNGKETIWLSTWGRDGKEAGRIEKGGNRPVAPEVGMAVTVDPFARWKAKGNYWTTKITATKPVASVSFTKYEVTDFKDDTATYSLIMLDKDMKETARRDGLKLRTRLDSGPPAAVSSEEEEVQCNALGRVTAARVEIAGAGLKTTLWMWRGLVVKSVSQGSEIDGQSELWETNLK